MYGWQQQIVGQRVTAVDLSPDREHLTLRFVGGGHIRLYTEGDCCSRSWVEHLEVPAGLDGATLLRIEDSDGIEVEHPDHECLKVYNTRFVTDRGAIVVEFRNSSNGYYGGWLEAEEVNLPVAV